MMVTPRFRLRRIIGIVLAIALLTASGAGCAADGAAPDGGDATTAIPTTEPTTTSSTATVTTLVVAPPTGPPTWLSLFADYPRYLHHKRRLAIATTNDSDQPIQVTNVALRAEHFTHLAAEQKSSTIAPGARVDLQVDFGEVVSCDETAPLTSSVEIELRTGDDPTPVSYEIAIDPAPLDEIRDTECRRLAVTEAVTIGFEDDWAIEGDSIAVDIGLERVEGDEVVRIDSLRGTEIFIMQPDPPTDDVVAVLEPGEAGLAVPVRFRVLRCDPHAVGQSSRTYEFKLWVAVGDRDAQLMILGPDDRLRSGLQQILDACLAATGG